MHDTHRPQPARGRRAFAVDRPTKSLSSVTRWPLRGLAVALAATAVTALPAAAADADSYRSDQWGLDTLGIPEASGYSTGCGATIAIVDSGVDVHHPDLRDHIVQGIDLVDNDDNPMDENGHGTHVAGIAAAVADNGRGIAGAAPCADIMPVRALGADGAGDENVIADGIRWAANHGADVINLSLGEEGFVGRLRKGGALNDAIVDATEAGAVVVAAAGNDGTAHFLSYRPDVDVVLVGAIDDNEEPADFSTFGDPRMLAAPGVHILSTVPEYPTELFKEGSHGYAYLDGTSMASPYVSGVAALLVAQGHSPRGSRRHSLRHRA
jgi:subtilisin family serine protease